MAKSQANNGSIDDDDILKAIRDHEDPCVTAVEIADIFGFSQQAAHWRLSNLAEKGHILRKKAGAKAVVWWLPENQSIASAT